MSGEDLATELMAKAEAPPDRSVTLAWRTSNGGAGTSTVHESCLVGGAPSADIVIEDPTVSRVHAELELRDDGPWIRDLQSRNGTWVGGVRVECAQLVDGTKIRLGAVVATARIGAVAAENAWPHDGFGRLVGRSHAMRKLFLRLDRAARSDATVLILGEPGPVKSWSPSRSTVRRAEAARPWSSWTAALCRRAFSSRSSSDMPAAPSPARSPSAAALSRRPPAALFSSTRSASCRWSFSRNCSACSRRARCAGSVRIRCAPSTCASSRRPTVTSPKPSRSVRSAKTSTLGWRSCRSESPLREHLDDLPLLIASFDGGAELLTPAVLDELRARRFAGNVRELRNYVERATLFGLDDEETAATRLSPGSGGERLELPLAEARAACVEAFEKRYLEALLERTGHNVSAAARQAGLDRTHLHRLLARHNIRR